MSVSIEQIKPGAVFRFKTAPRRVTSLRKPLGTGFKRLSSVEAAEVVAVAARAAK